MWFDLVLIDKVFANGALLSAHIRSRSDHKIVTDSLEDINSDFRAVNTKDFGPLRVYESDSIKTTFLESQLTNFVFEPHQITFQLDHFGIPVASGYYAIILPKGWRVAEMNIYDPYNGHKNVAKNRSYRDVLVFWDRSAQMSYAQFNMQSIGRGTFSIGVIASLRPANAEVDWQDQPGHLSIDFTDERHRNHFCERGYRAASDAVVAEITNGPEIPGVNVSLTGPSIDIVAWGRFLIGKIRRP